MNNINKLQINPDKMIRSEELMNLKGGSQPGYPSYACYWTLGMFGRCTNFLGFINTASCSMAYTICNDLYGGQCVEGGDCSPF